MANNMQQVQKVVEAFKFTMGLQGLNVNALLEGFQLVEAEDDPFMELEQIADWIAQSYRTITNEELQQPEMYAHLFCACSIGLSEE